MSPQVRPFEKICIPITLLVCLLSVTFVYAIIFPASEQQVTSPIKEKRIFSPTFEILPRVPLLYDHYWEYKWMVNKPMTFNGSEFNEQNGYLADHLWNFGDNTTASGAVVSHTYKEAGNYVVTLNVTDREGFVCVITREINILPMPFTTMYVSQPSEYKVGDIITLNIMISNVTGLFGWQAGMTFNPAILRCIVTENDNLIAIEMARYLIQNESYQIPNDSLFNKTALREGEFLQRGGATMWMPDNMVDGPFSGSGKIMAHGCALIGEVPPISGSGILATAVFIVIGEGELNIHLADVLLIGPTGTPSWEDIPVFVAT